MQGWMIGTVTGISLMAWMPTLPGTLGLSLLLAGLIASLVLRRFSRQPGLFLLAGLLSGIIYASLWGERLQERLAYVPKQGVSLELAGHVASPPQVRAYSRGVERQRFVFYSEDYPDCPFLLSYYGEQAIFAGQHLTLEARLKPPWGLANPGGFNFQTWLTQNRFCATGYVRDRSLEITRINSPELPLHQRLRQQVYNTLERVETSPVVRGLLLALVLGDRSQIPAPYWRLIRDTGLSHLFVISGLHVGLVAGFGFTLGAALARVPVVRGLPMAFYWLPRCLAMLAAVLFSGMAGFALPTQRALLMLLSLQAASLNYRRINARRSVLLALFLISVFDPLCTLNPGFWLSFTAVGLIFVLLSVWKQLPRWRQLLQIQCALSLGMGVFSSFWFGGLSLVSPLANLCMVPIVSIAIVPLCLISVLLLLVSPAHAGAAMTPLEWFIQLLPAPQAYLDILQNHLWLQVSPGAVAICLAGLATLLLMARPRVFRWHLLVLLLPLLLPVWTGYRQARLGPDDMAVTVLDVGQGLAVLVQSRDFAMLYDTGGGDSEAPNIASSVIYPFLQQQNQLQLNSLVISHGDRDHASGANFLLDKLSIGELWYGEHALDDGAITQRPCQRGHQIRHGPLLIRQLHPQVSDINNSSNDRSCVLLLDFFGFRVLLPGDISSEVEMELVREFGGTLQADLLIVPHHGSATSSSGPFIRAVAPQIAVVSAGFLNRFGHPRASVTERYTRYDTRLLNTAEGGAVSAWIERGELVEIQAWRTARRFYWQ